MLAEPVLVSATESAESLYSPLTARQYDVLDLASQGLVASAIGEALDVSTKTVKREKSEIIQLLGARNMVHVVRKACAAEVFAEPLSSGYVGLRLTRAMMGDLELISLGHSSVEVAAMKGLAPKTTKNRLELIRQRLGAKTMAHGIRIAFEAGIFA
jgi:DNA-binding NarL/FixJ family response regulator